MKSGDTQKPAAAGQMPSPAVALGILVAALAVGFVAARMMSLESQQRETVEQLKAIRQALESGAAGRGAAAAPEAAPIQAPPAVDVSKVSFSLSDSAVKGRSDAKLTLIEFSDFECPFCGRYVRDTYSQLQHDYVDSGKVRYVFRNFPLERIHPHALKAGVAAECARQQGKFWDMHDRLFANQQALDEAAVLQTARAVGVNEAALQQCMAGAGEAKIRRDQTEGARAGVTGTPYFFVGVTQRDGTVKVTRAISGAQPYQAFKTALDEALSAAS